MPNSTIATTEKMMSFVLFFMAQPCFIVDANLGQLGHIQCRKCLTPVKAIAIPSSSALATTS